MIIEGYKECDTISGEATPPGRGGISVIRISGKDALSIVSQLFDEKLPRAGEFKYGSIHSFAHPRVTIDQAVVSYFKTPHSFTGEDVLEISLHGSPVLVAAVQEELYKAGARPAQAGEFTFRAFINGRIDLTQAEAVSDLISSNSTESAGSALLRLNGSLKIAAQDISMQLLTLLSMFELELDFVEESVEICTKVEHETMISSVISRLQEMLIGYKHCHSLREGVRVALIGFPNVGKSSLFNRLLNQERAITHHEPGTTRDEIDSSMMIKGIEFRLNDTAGVRETEDDVEIVGVERTLQLAAQCDIVIEVSSVDIEAEYSYIALAGQGVIKVLNKIDLGSDRYVSDNIRVSAQRGTGIDELRNAMYHLAVGGEAVSRRTVNNERQYHLAEKALKFANNAHRCIQNESQPEITAEELRETLGCLDEMTGKRKLGKVLENIFSEFCIGK